MESHFGLAAFFLTEDAGRFLFSTPNSCLSVRQGRIRVGKRWMNIGFFSKVEEKVLNILRRCFPTPKGCHSNQMKGIFDTNYLKPLSIVNLVEGNTNRSKWLTF